MFRAMKARSIMLKQKKWGIPVYAAICVLIVLSLTILPMSLWLTSGIETLGITSTRGNSMLPTIKDGEILYVTPTKFERGEIVVAKCPQTDDYSASGIALLKRIVGLPGETVEITKDGVLINGTLLNEDYTKDQTSTLLETNKVNEIVLSDYEYFLLGDHRAESFDSRHVGPIHSMYFLYSLTTEPNDNTYRIWTNAVVVAVVNLVLIFTLPVAVLFFMTWEPNKEKAVHSNTSHKKKNNRKNKKNGHRRKK